MRNRLCAVMLVLIVIDLLKYEQISANSVGGLVNGSTVISSGSDKSEAI